MAAPKTVWWKKFMKELLGWGIIVVIMWGVWFIFTSLGLNISSVLTNSMEPKLKVGDAVVYVSATYKDPQVGDIIVFQAPLDDETLNMNIVHRWSSTTDTGKIVTRGDNNDTRDPWLLEKEDIKGVMVTSIPTSFFRNDWVIPLSFSLLVSVLVFRMILWIFGRKEEESEVVSVEKVKQEAILKKE
jgi:signal peptidase